MSEIALVCSRALHVDDCAVGLDEILTAATKPDPAIGVRLRAPEWSERPMVETERLAQLWLRIRSIAVRIMRPARRGPGAEAARDWLFVSDARRLIVLLAPGQTVETAGFGALVRLARTSRVPWEAHLLRDEAFILLSGSDDVPKHAA